MNFVRFKLNSGECENIEISTNEMIIFVHKKLGIMANFTCPKCSDVHRFQFSKENLEILRNNNCLKLIDIFNIPEFKERKPLDPFPPGAREKFLKALNNEEKILRQFAEGFYRKK